MSRRNESRLASGISGRAMPRVARLDRQLGLFAAVEFSVFGQPRANQDFANVSRAGRRR
jgi:hypothetical protein